MVVSKEVLIGSRLAAGFMVVADAADEMGLPRNVVLRAEAGVTNFVPKHYSRLYKVYGVSESFIVDGVISNERDKLAQRLSQILMDEGGNSSDVDADAISRLKEMRLAVGFASATSAASATGWKVPSYAAHEGGKRVLSAERLIGYALSFGCRPEFAVLGRGDMFANEDEAVDWWEHKRHDVSSAGSVVVWTWLNKSKDPRRQSFPVLEFTGNSFTLIEEHITLPVQVLPVDSVEGFVYGIRDKTVGGTKIVVVDPSKASNTILRVEGGRLNSHPSQVKDYVPHNPLSGGAAHEGMVLGTLLYAMEIHSVVNN